jgi:hypothetical protein
VVLTLHAEIRYRYGQPVEQGSHRIVSAHGSGENQTGTWHIGKKLETFQEFKTFFDGAQALCIPDFMNAILDFPRENILRWEFEPQACFAYKGIKRIGAIDQYE